MTFNLLKGQRTLLCNWDNKSPLVTDVLDLTFQMSLPDPIDGDTVMHHALMKQRFCEFHQMLQQGGNPFVKNKKGQSAAGIFKNYYIGTDSVESGVVINKTSNTNLRGDVNPAIAKKDLNSYDGIDTHTQCIQKIWKSNQEMSSDLLRKIELLIKEKETAIKKTEEANESLVHRAVTQKNLSKLLV